MLRYFTKTAFAQVQLSQVAQVWPNRYLAALGNAFSENKK